MKRLNLVLFLHVVAASVLMFTACKNNENDNLKVSPKNLKFNAIDDTKKILVVMTNVSTWTFEKSDEWFHVQQDSGKLIVTVDEYVELDDSRIGSISVTAGEAPPVTINVEQFGIQDFIIEKSGEVVLNPGQGWMLYGPPRNQSAATIALGTTGYTRFRWSLINPQENVYDWTSIDDAISQWAALGKQFAFGISMSTSPEVSEHSNIPQWVFDKGMQYETGIYPAKEPGWELYIPVWDDPVFLAAVKKFVAAFSAKYDGNPNIAYIDIRIYGLWGELHWDGVQNYKTRLNNAGVQSLHQIFCDNFRQTQLVQNFHQSPLTNALNQWAVNNGIGLRGDGIMGPEIWGSTSGTTLTEAIGKETIAWEFWGTYRTLSDGTYSNARWDDDRFIRIIKENKPNFISMSKNGSDAQYMLNQKPELIREAANLMGFNFSVLTASYINTISNGEALEISLSIENSGVTVMLTPCVTKLVLLDVNNKVVSSFTTDWNTKSIDGGEIVDFNANVVFSGAPVGTYKLAIGLYRNENDKKPTYNLDNKIRTQDGFYVIGFLRIEKQSSDPTPVISIITQPAATTNVTAGSITDSLSVVASVTQGATRSYQWYSNTTNSNTEGTAIPGATNATFAIPTTLTASGSPYYYFCEIRSTGGASSVSSNVATVTVNAPLFITHAALNIVYTPTLTLADLNALLSDGYTWENPPTQLTAGNDQQFQATYTDPSGNHEPVTDYITVNVAKADQTLTAANISSTESEGNVSLDGHATSSVDTNGGVITYTVTNAGTTGADISGDTLSYSSKGAATITATAAGNANYNSATTTFMLMSGTPYTVVVMSAGSGATGDGLYDAGATVSIYAGTSPEEGQWFINWTTSDADVNFDDATSANTTFVMPAGDVTVTAKIGEITGVASTFIQNLKVYPNPFTDMLHIAGADGCTLRVIDAAGATVHIHQIVNPDEAIRMEYLPAGVYFFRVEKNGMMHTIKTIKN